LITVLFNHIFKPYSLSITVYTTRITFRNSATWHSCIHGSSGNFPEQHDCLVYRRACKIAKRDSFIMSVCPSVFSGGTTWLPMDGFSV